ICAIADSLPQARVATDASTPCSTAAATNESCVYPAIVPSDSAADAGNAAPVINAMLATRPTPTAAHFLTLNLGIPIPVYLHMQCPPALVGRSPDTKLHRRPHRILERRRLSV